ncbi:CRAL-TRIO domain-containing protein [Smittium mucronatum]|uniref:CRAL-TRIO domain-containing protein n=1 Tax=Smittium mucronatum TaxID=133383 RepID=A0A1R0H0Z2_9FUNG|nr:CRAL-TRIO domain-containing protein [Smittium mucronatum]
MKPYLQNTKNQDIQIKSIVFLMESAVKIMPAGVSKLDIVVDLTKLSFSDVLSPRVSKMFFDVLQSHYPERLGRGIIINPPSIFLLTWKIISPFIDPATKKKVLFASFAAKKKAHRLTKSLQVNKRSSTNSSSSSTDVDAVAESPAGPESVDDSAKKEMQDIGPYTDLAKYFDPTTLEVSLGGKFDFKYNYSTYYPLLVSKYNL